MYKYEPISCDFDKVTQYMKNIT